MSEGGAPFHVVTTEGHLHSEWHDLDVAKRRAAKANADAEELGITTRYEVRELLDASGLGKERE